MKFSLNYKYVSILLIIFSFISFFVGFYMDEVSMGAGGYNGDFKYIQKSIKLFQNNTLKESILLLGESSNRPPLTWILHKYLNPFINSDIGFRRVVFFISLSIPVLLFLCFKEKFKKTDDILLALLSSIIFLNPFYRNGSYWGLEENYALITLLASILFYLKFSNSKKKSDLTIFCEVAFLTLSSSLCIYFDQKFLLIPLLCFIKIINSNCLLKFKIFSVFLYIFFSIPYLYLIILWGGVFPSNRFLVGQQYHIQHIGFATTMIAFYFFPFLIMLNENIKNKLIFFFKNKVNFYYILFAIIYLIYIIFFYNTIYFENRLDGGGIIKKISFILFDNIFYRKILIYSSFLFSWLLIIFFIENKAKNMNIVFYFLILGLITKPFYQEYLDPFLFFLIFFLFKIKLKLNFKRSILFYIYFFVFLISSNLYYKGLV